MKIYITFLLSILCTIGFSQVRPDQFLEVTSPNNSNFELYSQKAGAARRASLANVKKYMVPFLTDTVTFNPSATGNTTNLGEFVWDSNGTLWYIDGEGDAISFSNGGGPIYVVVDTTATQLVYAPGHGLTDTITLYGYVPVQANFTRANSSSVDSAFIAYAIDAPHVDSLLIMFSGTLSYLTWHGKELADQYYLQDNGSEDTTAGTVSIPTAIASDSLTLFLREVGTDIAGRLRRVAMPSAVITAFGGDPSSPTDAVVQAAIVGVYLPAGIAQPGTIFTLSYLTQSHNPTYQQNSPNANPLTPSYAWLWDGAYATRIVNIPTSVDLQDLLYGTLGTLVLLPIDSLMAGLAPTDDEVALWLDTNYTDNNLRLANGSLLYFVGDSTEQNPEYIWQLIDDISYTGAATEWERILKKIKFPSTGGDNGLFGAVTKAQADSLIAGSYVIPGATYRITGSSPLHYGGTDIFLTGLTATEFSPDGVGIFYAPKYDHAVSGFGIWSSDSTYITGDTVIWGGYHWINNAGNVGSDNDIFTLNAEWTVIPFDVVNYNVLYDEITYEYDNDWISRRYNAEADIEVISSYEDHYVFNDPNGFYPSISAMQWGNGLINVDNLGCYNQRIISSYNANINFAGAYQSNLTFSDNSYQDELTFSGGSYQDNLHFFNDSYQSGLTFSGSSYQKNINFFNNSYQYGLTFSGSSYQKDINFSRSFQFDIDFLDESYQYNLYFSGNSYQYTLDFSVEAYQKNLNFSGSSRQYNLVFSDVSSQENLSFSGFSGQYNLNFSNSSVQENLDFSSGSTQENLISTGSDQTNLTWNKHVVDSLGATLAASISEQTVNGNENIIYPNILENNSVSRISVFDDDNTLGWISRDSLGGGAGGSTVLEVSNDSINIQGGTAVQLGINEIATDSLTGATVTFDMESRYQKIFTTDMTSASATVTVTLSNPITAGVYNYEFTDITGTQDIAWPSNVKDLTRVSLGTVSYSGPFIVTLYYDGTNYIAIPQPEHTIAFENDSATTTTLAIDLEYKRQKIVEIDMASATSVTITISNQFYGANETGVYTFHFSGVSGTDNVTWPANFYDASYTALGTDALTANTIYTCYYNPDSSKFVCK